MMPELEEDVSMKLVFLNKLNRLRWENVEKFRDEFPQVGFITEESRFAVFLGWARPAGDHPCRTGKRIVGNYGAGRQGRPGLSIMPACNPSWPCGT